MKDIIIKEQLFMHPIQTVWEAITQEDLMSSWFLPASFKAEKGFKYSFNAAGGDCSPITGEIIIATPYILQYTWIVTEQPATTIVTWTLESVNGGTKLRLEHSGISNYAGETAIEMFGSFDGGWDNCINGLITFLKEGVHAG
jgi:uncharacterized protein YndB with AHSA1/START domain